MIEKGNSKFEKRRDRNFDDVYTLKQFYDEELQDWAFPYMGFGFSPFTGRLTIRFADGKGYYLRVSFVGAALEVFYAIIRREPSLTTEHLEARMDRITDLLSFASGGPGYEELQMENHEI